MHGITAVLPAFNEAENLAFVVSELNATLCSAVREYEIIVVNDGSSDNTASVLAELQKKYSLLKTISFLSNQGYGRCFCAGVHSAKYEYVLFTDTDGQFVYSDLLKILPVSPEVDAYLGYRVNKQYGILRNLCSRIFNWLIRIVFGLKVRDINCAVKLYKKGVCIPDKLISRRFFVNAELLIRLHSRGCVVHEFPVTHRPRKTGVSTVRCIEVLNTFIDAARFVQSRVYEKK
ncbi:MAG: glycosyltransferase family 2 protein [Elusimicrobiota bacterium]